MLHPMHVPGATLPYPDVSNVVSSALFSNESQDVQMFQYDASTGSHLHTGALYALGWRNEPGTDLNIEGTNLDDTVVSGGGAGSLDIRTYDGNDAIVSVRVNEPMPSHLIEAGDGDDNVHINNELDGLSGYRLVDGGLGNDTISLSYATAPISFEINTYNTQNFENIISGQADDFLIGSSDDNIIRGNSGSDIIYGEMGNDILWGFGEFAYFAGQYLSQSYEDLGDTLYGGAGDDSLYGEFGDDILHGGPGRDELRGGEGNDTFVLTSGEGSYSLETADVIKDFEDGTDVLGLDAGLGLQNLNITQGTDEHALSTIIQSTDTAEILAVLENTDAQIINEQDFSLDTMNLRYRSVMIRMALPLMVQTVSPTR